MFRILRYRSIQDLAALGLGSDSQFIRYYVNNANTNPPVASQQKGNNIQQVKNKGESIVIPIHNSSLDLMKQKPALNDVNLDSNTNNQRLPWLPSPYVEPGKMFSQYKKLSKFRLTTLVVITAMGGYAIAPAAFDVSTFVLCSLGTGLVSAAANSINQYHEVPFDSQMSRTKNRVLVTGIMTPLHAIGFATVSATVGLSMLYFGVNGLTAALGAGNLFLYTSVYTPLKRVSIANTWVGSIVGAIPPLMGWASCTGSLDIGAWILAGMLYAWQFPHFNALSWNLRQDYSRAGYRMMAVTNPDLCRRTTLRYTLGITGLTLLAPIFDVTNAWFALESLPLNAYFCYLAYKFYQHSDSKTSRKLFRFSLLHLPALMILFIFNKKYWFLSDSQEETKSVPDKSIKLPSSASLTNLLPLTVSATKDVDSPISVKAENHV